MLEQILSFFISAFNYPGLSWLLILVAIAIAVFVGAVWLLPYWPPFIKKPWLWGVCLVSAILTWSSIAFIQVPLQLLTGQVLIHFWDQATLIKWILLAGIPQILLSGFVQEAAKLLPALIYRWRDRISFTPRFGLIVGAVSGVGFGVFEAIWIFNTIFASGWTWSAVESAGLMALLGFFERFFTVGFHIAVSSLACYGLARDRGWAFYLIASLLHGAVNYSVVLLQAGVFSALQVEVYVAASAIAIYAVALWLCWHKSENSRIETSQVLQL